MDKHSKPTMTNTKKPAGAPLTAHQLCVAVFIHAYHAMNDNMPNYFEIGKAFGCYPNASNETVKRLMEIGVFEKTENFSKYRFARTPAGAAYRAQIVAKHVEQGGKA